MAADVRLMMVAIIGALALASFLALMDATITGYVIQPPRYYSSTCFDTDGMDVHERGYVTNFAGGKKIYDSCSLNNASLYEGVCSDGGVATLIVDCAADYGMECRAGACRAHASNSTDA